MIKTELRKKYKAVRSAVEEREAKSQIIASALFHTELFKSCSDIFLYSNSGTEVSTAEILKESLSLGKKVAYPKCTDKDGNMEFYYINSVSELCEGMYGIYEPESYKELKAVPSCESLIVVPGLAFDTYGYRLGYGKGYYDRYLSLYPCKAVGIAFSECFCKELPHGIYDFKINCLITDKKEYYFD